MMNFLFGLLCAVGILFGAGLTLTGLSNSDYLAVAAGGVFLFGGLLTFGLGQMGRSMNVLEKRIIKLALHRDEPQARVPGPNGAHIVPDAPDSTRWPDPPRPNPVLERVASRFARPGR